MLIYRNVCLFYYSPILIVLVSYFSFGSELVHDTTNACFRSLDMTKHETDPNDVVEHATTQYATEHDG